MNRNRLARYLLELNEAAAQALIYVEGMEKDAFFADKRTQDAVLMQLIVIGEAVSNITRDYRSFLDNHPAMPWRDITDMRNRVAHGYSTINVSVVWDTVQLSVVELRSYLPVLIEDAKIVFPDTSV